MKTKTVQMLLALACVSVAMPRTPAAAADFAIPEWNPEWNGFHSSDTSGPDWMSPQLNLIYRAPDRRWSSALGHEAGDDDALARFAAQLETIVSSAFDAERHGAHEVNIFIVVGGHHWRLRDHDWKDIREQICAPPDDPDGPTIPEPLTASAALGLGVGAAALLRRIRRRDRAAQP